MNDDNRNLNEQGSEGDSGPEAAEFHAPVKTESAPLGGSEVRPEGTPANTQTITDKDRSALARVRAGLDRVLIGPPGSDRWKYLDEPDVASRPHGNKAIFKGAVKALVKGVVDFGGPR